MSTKLQRTSNSFPGAKDAAQCVGAHTLHVSEALMPWTAKPPNFGQVHPKGPHTNRLPQTSPSTAEGDPCENSHEHLGLQWDSKAPLAAFCFPHVLGISGSPSLLLHLSTP